MIEKPPNLKAILPSAQSLLTLMLNRPYLYSSYLAYSGVTSNNVQKSHDFPTTRIYSIVFHEQVNKDKVTLCKIVQTSSFYDVHTMNVLRARSELIISDDLATVSGRVCQPTFPAVSPDRGDLLADPAILVTAAPGRARWPIISRATFWLVR